MAGYFSQIFGDSPVAPIQDHANKVYKAAHALLEFFDCVAAEDWEGVKAHREKIVRLENEADDLKKTIRSQIKTGVFMPVSHGDLLVRLDSA